MKLFRSIAVVCLLLASLCAAADDSILNPVTDSLVTVVEDSVLTPPLPARPYLTDSMPGVQLVQDSMVAVLLDAAMHGSYEFVEIDGYRVQVYSSNQQQTAKSEALSLEARLIQRVSQPIYVLYTPPFWKVRIGDFRTYEEARDYKKLFVQTYPEAMGNTYIVRDKIKVLQ